MTTPYDLLTKTSKIKEFEWGDHYDFPRDLVGYSENSFDRKWPGGAKISVSFGAKHTMLNGGMHSETHLCGARGAASKIQRAKNIESEYDYGSGVGTAFVPSIRQIQLQISSTPWAKLSKITPQYRWIDYANMPPEQEKAYIKKDIETIAKICGEPPKAEMGVPLLWNSDSYADDLPYWIDVPAKKNDKDPKGMLRIPYSYGFGSPTHFYDHVKNAFDTLYEERCGGSPKMMTIALHCRCIGKPGRFNGAQEDR
ncbi:Chitin deacetylase 1 [Lachnellula cervina]|uniref:Chitin deacetylase 1 n=1 Tax=Lachnellula cervina TaxID=1316786 RepID=A0A7D8ULD8_9HELO|nr:Chitin deacetylase 1 [Lachnellula cervina]